MSEDPETLLQVATFLAPTVKTFRLKIDTYHNRFLPANLALQSLSLRSDIKLERFEVVDYESDLEDGVSDCLRSQRDLTYLSLPSFRIGAKVDRDLGDLPMLRSLYTGVKDGTAGSPSVGQWLVGMKTRFPYLTHLGLSFDRRYSPTPNIPLREMAPLIQMPSLLDVKLDFNPAIKLGDEDVRAIARAWPALQSLWIYNWGLAIERFPISILSSFATHMPATLKRVSFHFAFDTIPPLRSDQARFPSLEMLGIGRIVIRESERPAVAAFLAKLCPPGLVIRCAEDLSLTSMEDTSEMVEVTQLMRRYQEESVRGTRH